MKSNQNSSSIHLFRADDPEFTRKTVEAILSRAADYEKDMREYFTRTGKPAIYVAQGSLILPEDDRIMDTAIGLGGLEGDALKSKLQEVAGEMEFHYFNVVVFYGINGLELAGVAISQDGPSLVIPFDTNSMTEVSLLSTADYDKEEVRQAILQLSEQMIGTYYHAQGGRN